ncbi:MAG: hypothetical protein C4326_06650 [Ignavibacteria bacterium]
MLAQGPWRARLSPEERTAQLKKALNLSDEQAAKVKAIFEQHDKELRKLFDQKKHWRSLRHARSCAAQGGRNRREDSRSSQRGAEGEVQAVGAETP